MGRKRAESESACPHCGSRWVRRNGSSRGKPRWQCGDCGRTVGATYGTAMYGLHTPVEEVARTLLILMHRGSLRGTEEISGHKWETVRGWVLRAHEHAEALTEVLVRDLELDEVEADAFWSFVGNAMRALQSGQVRHRRWALEHRNAAEASPQTTSRDPGRGLRATRRRAAPAGGA